MPCGLSNILIWLNRVMVNGPNSPLPYLRIHIPRHFDPIEGVALVAPVVGEGRQVEVDLRFEKVAGISQTGSHDVAGCEGDVAGGVQRVGGECPLVVVHYAYLDC